MASNNDNRKKVISIGLISMLLMGLISMLLIGLIIVDKRCRYTYDPEVAAEYATTYAEKKSRKLCAYYVRQSIEAGGCPTFFFPSSACEYKDFLTGLGFEMIEKPKKPETGDIVVFGAVKGHPHGHIAIWNGRQWVSDFKQRSIIVNNAYNNSEVTYHRLDKGKHKRKLFAINPPSSFWEKSRLSIKLILKKPLQ